MSSVEGFCFLSEVWSSMAQSVGPIHAILRLISETKGSKHITEQRNAVAR